MTDSTHSKARTTIAGALKQLTGDDPEHDDGLDADTIIAALERAGLAVVPREPTPEMAGDTDANTEPYWRGVRRSIWADMLKKAGA